jgi:NAD-dependent SIR2 family protein deacetylase
MKCSKCGAALTNGYWNIPTERGLLRFCPACVAPPRLPPNLTPPPPVEVVSALRPELMNVGERNRR